MQVNDLESRLRKAAYDSTLSLTSGQRVVIRDAVDAMLPIIESEIATLLAQLTDRDDHIDLAYKALGAVNRSIYLFDLIRQLREHAEMEVKQWFEHQKSMQAESERKGLDKAFLAYESHYAQTPDSENCLRCGRNWRDPIHLRIGETTETRIRALKKGEKEDEIQKKAGSY